MALVFTRHSHSITKDHNSQKLLGYLALHVIQLLLQRGYTVTTTVRPTVSEERLKSLKLLSSNYPNKLHLQQLDLLQPVSDSIIGQALDGIIHCASPVPMKFEDGWKEVIAPALQGTEELLKAAVRNNISTFIYTSSIGTLLIAPDWLTRSSYGTSSARSTRPGI